jgi:hypothetical protein
LQQHLIIFVYLNSNFFRISSHCFAGGTKGVKDPPLKSEKDLYHTFAFAFAFASENNEKNGLMMIIIKTNIKTSLQKNKFALL